MTEPKKKPQQKSIAPNGSSKHDRWSLADRVLNKMTGQQIFWLLAMAIVAYVVLKVMEIKP